MKNIKISIEPNALSPLEAADVINYFRELIEEADACWFSNRTDDVSTRIDLWIRIHQPTYLMGHAHPTVADVRWYDEEGILAGQDFMFYQDGILRNAADAFGFFDPEWNFPEGPWGWANDGTSLAPTEIARIGHVAWYQDELEQRTRMTEGWVPEALSMIPTTGN